MLFRERLGWLIWEQLGPYDGLCNPSSAAALPGFKYVCLASLTEGQRGVTVNTPHAGP